MLLQSQRPSLRPMTTAHLAQTMTLLELTTGELQQKIDNALSSNPALELIEESRCPRCHRLLPYRGACPTCSAPSRTTGDQPIVFISPRRDFYHSRGHASDDDDETNREEWAAAVEDLPTFVLRQIAPELPAEDRSLAAHLLTSLDEDGLLTVSILEVARYHHVPPSRVEHVQRQIQRAEPVGVGSATPQEALLVQLEVLAESRPVPDLAGQVIQQAMDLLSRRAYSELGRRLGIPARQAEQISLFIS